MYMTSKQAARYASLMIGACLVSSCVEPMPPDVWDENVPPDMYAPHDGPGRTEATENPTTSPAPPPDIQQAPPATLSPEEYPTAKPTSNPDRVISPYEPFNVIDVSGFHSGQLARDPSNRKIFRIP